MRKFLVLIFHVAAVLVITAAVTVLWSDVTGEKGIAWINAEKYEDSPQFAEKFSRDIEGVRRFGILSDAFGLSEEVDPDQEVVLIDEGGSQYGLTLGELMEIAGRFGCTYDPASGQVVIIETEVSREEPESVRVAGKKYDPWYADNLTEGPSQGVMSLRDLSFEVVSAVAECYALKAQYQDNPGNFRYYVCQPGPNGDYTIIYNDDISAIAAGKFGKYVWYRAEEGTFLTNVDPAPANLDYRKSSMFGDLPDSEFEIGAAVDTAYPYQDSYREASQQFSGKVQHAYKWIGVCLVGLAVFTITLVMILHEASVEDLNTENAERRHLLDKAPFETAVVLCAALAVLFYYVFKATLCRPMEAILPYTTQEYWRNTAKVLITYGLVVVLLRSAIRRYRRGTLYSGSLFSRLEQAIEDYLDNGKLSAVVFVKFFAFVLLNVGGPLAAAWLFFKNSGPDGDSRMILVSSLLITAVIVIDAFVCNRLFRDASQRDRIGDTLKSLSEGETGGVLDEKGFEGQNLETVRSINHISTGLAEAVRDQVKSERLKADLITNVSHDIKTPLTSIINYVGLLKREHIQNEKAAEYIDILEQKSQRLKNLTEDLVEASKASSGNIRMEPAKIDMVELTEQAAAEFEHKFTARGLDFIFDAPQELVYVRADGRHLWRVFENLLNNAAKYSMENTRVYCSVSALKSEEGEKGVFVLKNISETKLNISPEELTERFVRGDVSRTTEGSGLGLSIAKSLTRLMGGELKIEIDGDLYKASVILPVYEEKDLPAEENAAEVSEA